MIREWGIHVAFGLLMAGLFLAGFVTRPFLTAPRQDCFAAQEATAMVVQRGTWNDDKERWWVTVAFAPADWHRTYASPQEAPRTRHMGFWSAEGTLGTMAPIIAYTTTPE